jgi:anti-sigma factor RsiW
MRFFTWSRTPDMACQELVEAITDYLEGRLSQRDRRRFEAHIEGCPHCTEYLEQMRATITATGQLRAQEIPPGQRDALLDAFREYLEGA